MLCDFDHPADISYRLYLLSQVIITGRARERFRQSIISYEVFADFILGTHTWPYREVEDVMEVHGIYRTTRPPMDERVKSLQEMNQLEGHRANHQWLFLLTPLWLEIRGKGFPEERGQKATLLIGMHSNTLDSFFLSGTSVLTVLCMTLKENIKDWFVDQLTSGSVSALVNGCVRSFLVRTSYSLILFSF